VTGLLHKNYSNISALIRTETVEGVCKQAAKHNSCVCC